MLSKSVPRERLLPGVMFSHSQRLSMFSIVACFLPISFCCACFVAKESSGEGVADALTKKLDAEISVAESAAAAESDVEHVKRESGPHNSSASMAAESKENTEKVRRNLYHASSIFVHAVSDEFVSIAPEKFGSGQRLDVD